MLLFVLICNLVLLCIHIVVPDGVGLSYSIHPKHCVFNITALKKHQWTARLCDLLDECLFEVQTLIEMEHGGGLSTTSKL
jgi:hypothetical protein